MDVSACHANVRELVSPERGLEWRFGLALSSDGIWRVHSWAWGAGRVIETTEPRDRYVGIDISYLVGFRDGLVQSHDSSDPYVIGANRLGPRLLGQRGGPRRRLAWLRTRTR